MSANWGIRRRLRCAVRSRPLCEHLAVLGLRVDTKHASVELIADDEGLALLERVVTRLRNGDSHDHLMTEEWGGNELVVLDEKPGFVPVHMLTLRRT